MRAMRLPAGDEGESGGAGRSREEELMDRIAVPDGCPCDFRYSGVPPSPEDCRSCGRRFGSWLACRHAPKPPAPVAARAESVAE